MRTKAIAIIPARGGSKRIPRKNIKEFCGKPMIAYSIQAAINSGCFEKIIVSTDDIEIAEVAKKYGAEVPYLRSESLSNDYATTAEVMEDAVKYLEEDIQYVCCIYATAPMLLSEDLRLGFSAIKNNDLSQYAFSITDYPYPIQRALKVDGEGGVSMFNSKYFLTRSQDLEEAWHDAGQFYWGRKEAWANKKAVFSSISIGIEIPRYRAQDIDTMRDWEMAELLFQSIKTNE